MKRLGFYALTLAISFTSFNTQIFSQQTEQENTYILKEAIDSAKNTLDNENSNILDIVLKISDLSKAITNFNSDNLNTKWELVWSDEFAGDSINLSKWAFQEGTKADGGADDWGNQELQYYTKDNARVEDGHLIISAKREDMGGKSYTSARLWTEPTYSKKYGKIEARISLPEGQGLWPAFWMLPKSLEYGVWAASGEIDIMEARGRNIYEVDGTIHYGKQWPNNVYSGSSYRFPQSEDITGMHIYSIEWEPGEIRWYVDGNLYHTENNWYSKGNNEMFDYTFPAPFDQEFYILLNLAVGGTYDGNKVPDETVIMPAEMKVDYVRVYELKGEYPEHQPTQKDNYPSGSRQPVNGNFILDTNFNNIIQKPTSLSTNEWNHINIEGGNSTTQNIEGGVKVNISNQGTQPYSIQLIDHMPLAKGRSYKLTFDAKSNEQRKLLAQFGAGEQKGWVKYSESFEANLNTNFNTYSYFFTMNAQTDSLARLEFNMGLNTSPVYIKNVKVEEVEQPFDLDAPKQPLNNGNHIYNGSFSQGPNRTLFWDFKTNLSTFISNKHTKQAEINTISSGDILYQKGINLLSENTYKLIFKARASQPRNININFVSEDNNTIYGNKNFSITTNMATYEMLFDMKEATDIKSILQFLLDDTSGTLYLDDVVLIRTTDNNLDYSGIDLYPLKNGDFSLGFTNWTKYMEFGGLANTSIINDDKITKVDITSLGNDNWNVMLMNENLNFTQGVTYIVEFDMWADEARGIEVKLENASYIPSFAEEINLTTTKKKYTYEFRQPTNDILSLKFLLGNTNNAKTTAVYIDNVDISVKNAPLKRPIVLIPNEENNNLGDIINIKVLGSDEWINNISSIEVNNIPLSSNQYSLTKDTLIIQPNVFNLDGIYNITVKSNGYTDSKVKQIIKSSDGNIILNGDFTNGFDNWGFWNEQQDYSQRFIGNNKALIKINYNGGIHPEWNIPIGWSTQFFQENIELKANKTYNLSFDASSTVARPIAVELVDVGIEGNQLKFNINANTNTYTATLQPTNNINLKLNFLLGNIINETFETPSGEHSITLDNIKITEN